VTLQNVPDLEERVPSHHARATVFREKVTSIFRADESNRLRISFGWCDGFFGISGEETYLNPSPILYIFSKIN